MAKEINSARDYLENYLKGNSRRESPQDDSKSQTKNYSSWQQINEILI